MVNNIKPVDIWLIMVQVRNPNHFWDKGQIRGQFWIFKVLTMSCFSNLVRFPDMNHKKDIKMCQRRVTKKNFMKFWQRAAEIWDLKEGQNWDFSKSYISAALCQNFMKFFLVTLLWHISNVLFMVHIREPLQIWEKRHGWNLENPKLAPSLAFILEMVGISDLDHNKSNINWLNVVLHTEFGGLPIKWSWDIKAWKS